MTRRVPASLSVRNVDPFDPELKRLLDASSTLMLSLYPVDSNRLDGPEELARSQACLLGAYCEGQGLIACGAVKVLEDDGRYGEVKRVFVRPEARGMGAAKAIMAALEQHLLHKGITLLRLETGIFQQEAIGLYRALGYRQRGPFGQYQADPLSVFMEKRLD